MVLLHEGRSEGHLWPLQAAIGGAVGSVLTQGASAGEDHIRACLQGCTSLPGARRPAPALQCPPQGDGRDSGMLGLKERGPPWLPTDTLARSMLGASIRTQDGWEMHGRTLLRCPARWRRWGRHGVPRLTRRGQHALDRDCPTIQALGCAPGGLAGRYGLMVLPLLIQMACEVEDPWLHGWRKIFPLTRQSSARKVGGKHGGGCRYQGQRVHG
jgi:hypothetical protein